MTKVTPASEKLCSKSVNKTFTNDLFSPQGNKPCKTEMISSHTEHGTHAKRTKEKHNLK